MTEPPRTQPQSNHVVVISLDGFAGWALDDPYLPVPTLRRMATAGHLGRKSGKGFYDYEKR